MATKLKFPVTVERVVEKPKVEDASASSAQTNGQTVLQVPLIVNEPVRPRPMILEGVTYQIQTPVEDLSDGFSPSSAFRPQSRAEHQNYYVQVAGRQRLLS